MCFRVICFLIHLLFCQLVSYRFNLFMKYFIVLLVFINLAIAGFCQIPQPPVNVPTPNVYSFLKYGNTPVTYFTGLPQVQIPIESVEEKGVGYGISLSYDASGFKPDVRPSWIGMNWNLAAGGVISRQIKGLPDEFDFTLTGINNIGQQINARYRKGFYHNGYLSSDLETALSYSTNCFVHYNYTSGGYYSELNHIIPFWDQIFSGNGRYEWIGGVSDPMTSGSSWMSNGKGDAFSDEYNISLPGLSAKFYFRGGEVFIESAQKIKIKPFAEMYTPPFSPAPKTGGGTVSEDLATYSPWYFSHTYPKTFSGFIVTDDQGVNYYFGKCIDMLDSYQAEYSSEYFNSVAIDYSIAADNNHLDYWKADAWHLTRIELPNKRKIDFEYQRMNYVLSLGVSSYSIGMNGESLCSKGGDKVDGVVNSPVYLKSITSDLINCSFYFSNSSQLTYQSSTNYPTFEYPSEFGYFVGNVSNLKWPKLDSIQVKRYDKPKYTFAFNYNNNPNERLMLTEAYRKAGKSIEKYTFQYNQSYSTQPKYFSNELDHWGFWNGRVTLSSSSDYYNSRNPDLAHTNAFVLNKITYPTGGYTELEYELNKYSKYVKNDRTQVESQTTNSDAGGLRLKAAKDYDGISSYPVKRLYYYVNDYQNTYDRATVDQKLSSGVLNLKPLYYWNGSILTGRSFAASGTSIGGTLKVFSNQSLSQSFESYHIGYSQVVEKVVKYNESESGSVNGYTVYKYTNHDNGYQDEPYVSSVSLFDSPYNYFSSRREDRGKLLELRKISSSEKCVYKKTLTYKPVEMNVNGTRLFSLKNEGQFFTTASGCNSQPTELKMYIVGTSHKVFTAPLVVDSEIEESYDKDGNNPIQSSVQYEYNVSNWQPNKITSTDSKKNIKREYITYPSDYSSVWLMERIINRNEIKVPVSKLSTLQKDGSTSEFVIAGELNEYSLRPNFSDDYWLIGKYSLDTSTPILKSEFSNSFTVSTNDYYTRWDKNNAYRRVAGFDWYDTYKNPIGYELKEKIKGIIGYSNKGLNPSKIVRGGTFSRSASMGFEDGNADRFGWQWTFNGGIITSDFKQGEKSFKGTTTLNVSDAIYNHSGGFLAVNVDFWFKGTNAPTVQAKSSSTSSQYSYSGTVISTSPDGWKLYRFFVSNAPIYSITIDSGVGLIDEVEIYPREQDEFQIETTSYSYNKDGQLSKIIDNNGKPTSYEYDQAGRLSLIRDYNNDIQKQYSYNISNQIGSLCPKPIVNSITNNGVNLTINYTPTSGSNSCLISVIDFSTNNLVSSSTAACGTTFSASVPKSGKAYSVIVTSYTDECPNGVSSDPATIYIPETGPPPVINSLTVSNNIITVNYTSTPGASGCNIKVIDLTTNQESNSTSGCYSPRTSSVSVGGRTYRVIVTSFVSGEQLNSEYKDIYVP